MTAEELARFFHETYERLAPAFGYETRRESAVPWAEVPDANRDLMVAVAEEVLASLPLPISAWNVELVKMNPRQRRIAKALSESCDEWYKRVGDGSATFTPDVREISRIAAAAATSD